MIDQVKVTKVIAYLKGIIDKHGQAKPGMNKIAASCGVTIQEAADCCNYIAEHGPLKRTYERIIPHFEEGKPNPQSRIWTIWR